MVNHLCVSVGASPDRTDRRDRDSGRSAPSNELMDGRVSEEVVCGPASPHSVWLCIRLLPVDVRLGIAQLFNVNSTSWLSSKLLDLQH